MERSPATGGRLAEMEARLARVERLVDRLLDSERSAVLLRLEAEERAAEGLGELLIELEREVKRSRAAEPAEPLAPVEPLQPLQPAAPAGRRRAP